MVRNGSMVQGAKPRVWVKRWWREVWSRERNCGFGSSPAPPECGPGRETAGLGQTLVAGNVVQGEKPRVWVNPGPAAVWSVEQNCGVGSSSAPPQCGPGRETVGLGQALVAESVVQGAKPRPWVNPGPAAVWSRERNCAPGSNPAPPECGPGRETAPPGQARPRRSVVQGEKPRPRVKPGPAAVWSRERNRGPGSNPAPPECGPGRETAGLGQARPRPSMVQGEKSRGWVKPDLARVWSREQNRGFGSNPAPPQYGPGSKTAGLGQTRPRRSVVQGEKPRPGSTPAPPKHGPRT